MFLTGRFSWQPRTAVLLIVAMVGCNQSADLPPQTQVSQSPVEEQEPIADVTASTPDSQVDSNDETMPTSPDEADHSAPGTADLPTNSNDASANSTPLPTLTEPTQRFEEQVASFQIPPAWLADVEPRWDIARPWKEARLEIRRLLGTNIEEDRKDGIKLLWEYYQKNDIGDGHEYGFDLYLGGEAIWAIKAYREWLPQDHDYLFVRGHCSLASLYTKFGEYEQAEQALNHLMTLVPKHDYPTMRMAETHDSFGDLYVAWGKVEKAKHHYGEAIRLYPQGKPQYGKHLLPRRAKKVQAKLDLLSYGPLDGVTLTDGRYQETALGYSGDVHVTVIVKDGRVDDISLQHQEKIDQNACVLIPQRITEQQSLRVDGITGATITKDAIVGGTFGALKKAGLP